MTTTLPPEESLDPQDWDAFRTLSHQMVDDLVDYLAGVNERPVWQPVPDEIKGMLHEPPPRQPQGETAVYEQFRDKILPHPLGNIHPRFWGWVIGTGFPYAVLADMLASGMNSNMAGGDHVATYVEAQVIQWFKELFGFRPEASGLVVSGGSVANLIGLTVGRNVQAGYDVRKEGVTDRLMFYSSVEVHSSITKAIGMLGVGERNLRLLPVNTDFQVDVAAMRAAIEEDLAAGLKPVCVIGSSGTTNTGSTDDLNALADLAKEFGLWFHIDGAFGAWASLSERLRPQVAGLERADSLAFDLHKWMYMPAEAACILVRSEREQAASFALSMDYASHVARGISSGHSAWGVDMGPQMSRSFKALKVWMSLKAYGLDKFIHLIEQNVNQAQYLAELVEGSPNLDLLAPVPLNVVCFRYIHPSKSGSALDEINEEITMRLHERGIAVPSQTSLNGQIALRCAITNHRSRREDFELLVEKVVDLGEEIINTA